MSYCPQANQTRSCFPISAIRSKDVFDLIHIDTSLLKTRLKATEIKAMDNVATKRDGYYDAVRRFYFI